MIPISKLSDAIRATKCGRECPSISINSLKGATRINLGKTLSVQALKSLQSVLEGLCGAHVACIGILADEIVVSINEGNENEDAKPNRKRQRRQLLEEDVAQRAIKGIKAICGRQKLVGADAVVDAAGDATLALVKLRGLHGEVVVIATSTTFQEAPRATAAAPSILLGACLGGGVEIKLDALVKCVGKADDGMLTTDQRMLQERIKFPEAGARDQPPSAYMIASFLLSTCT